MKMPFSMFCNHPHPSIVHLRCVLKDSHEVYGFWHIVWQPNNGMTGNIFPDIDDFRMTFNRERGQASASFSVDTEDNANKLIADVNQLLSKNYVILQHYVDKW